MKRAGLPQDCVSDENMLAVTQKNAKLKIYCGSGGGRFEGTAYDELVGGANVGGWEVADTEGTSYASFILTVGFFPPRR